MANKASLITLFENGDTPLGTDFSNLISSNFNLDEAGTQTASGSMAMSGALTAASVTTSTRLSLGVQTVAGIGTIQAAAAPISSSYIIATNGASDRAYLLPSTVGTIILFRNSGANTALIFPPTGGQIDALGANNSISVASGARTMIICETATQYASYAV